MVFILASDGRDGDAEGAFRRYSEYLEWAKSPIPTLGLCACDLRLVFRFWGPQSA